MEREILGDLHRQICGFLESSASAAAEPAAPGSKRPRVEEPSAGRDAAVDLLSARAALEEQKVLREMDAERFSAQLEAEKARRSAAEERARRAAVDASARAEEIASSRVAAERSQSDAREKQLTERIARLVKSVADAKNEAERHRADADRLRRGAESAPPAAPAPGADAQRVRSLEAENARLLERAEELKAQRDAFSAATTAKGATASEERRLRLRVLELERSSRRLELERDQLRERASEATSLRERLSLATASLARERDALQSVEERRAKEHEALAASEQWCSAVDTELRSCEGLFELDVRGLSGEEEDAAPAEDKTFRGPPSAARVVSVLRKALRERCRLLAEKGDAERRARHLEHALGEKERASDALQRELRAARGGGAALEDSLRDAKESSAFFSQRFRQSQKAMEELLDRVAGAGEPGAAVREALAALRAEGAAQQRRNEELSRRLELSRKREDAAAPPPPPSPAAEERREKAMRDLVDARARCAELEAELVRVRASGGAAGRAVLHRKENPFSMAREERRAKATEDAEELKRLRREVAALRAEGAAGAAGGGAAAAALAAQQVDTDKLRARLKSMFAERVRVLREATYLLTGYKVDMAADRERPQIRLRSMFAEAEEDCLLFGWTGEQGSSDLQLLETPFAQRLDDDAFAFLRKFNSVPAFLSHVTLELFGRQTMMG